MQYMLLIYTDPAKTAQQGAKMNDAYFAVTQEMKAAGVLRAGDALHGAETATSVRKRGTKVETMDGPFAETKETLGGYYLIDCADLDAAIGWAAKIPGAAIGTVEVRPVVVWE